MEKIKALVIQHIKPNDKNNIFLIDDYQLYLAACIVTGEKKHIYQIHSGQGKTWIMIFAALYLIHEKNFEEVNVLTANAILCDQLKKEIKPFLPRHNNKITYYHCEEMSAIPMGGAVWLVDEADQCLENFISFDSEFMLNGFAYIIQSEYTFYFSATMPDYFINLLGIVGSMVECTAFVSRYQISSNMAEHFQIKDYLFPQIDSLLAEFKKALLKATKPVIIFIEKDQTVLVNAIQEMTREIYGRSAYVIMNQQDYKNQASVISQDDKGVLIIHAMFGRGVNIKFAVDAICLVVANGVLLNWEETKQMAGRSSRRFGPAVAVVYVLVDFEVTQMERGGRALLEGRQANLAQDEGLEIAETLTLKMPKLSDAVYKSARQTIAKAFPTSTSWRITRASLAHSHKRTHKFITTKSYMPQSDGRFSSKQDE